MVQAVQQNYLKKCLLLFLLLLVCALAINLIGNYWLYSIKNNEFSQKIVNSIFKPLDFLFLFGSLLRDILITTLLINIVFKFINNKTSFIEILYIVIGANFLFIAQNIFDLFWVYVHKKELSVAKMLDFQSLSLNNCFTNIPSYLYHASVAINLWELAYMFLLAFLLKTHLNRSFVKSFGLVFLAYGVPLILWIIFATFIQISNA